MDDDGWDLHAVVRSCAANTYVSTIENTPRLETVQNESKSIPYTRELEEIYKSVGKSCVQPLHVTAGVAAATICTMTTTTTTTTTTSIPGERFVFERPFGDSISFIINNEDHSSSHARKRKNKRKKRVIGLREEELSNDGWAWRKYGQKPIKGSPHPRNYYRCSTTKDCLAKKQVERSPSDTSNFVVSYYGDHLHPRPTHLSSLAGTTRSTKSNMLSATLPELPTLSSSSSPPSTSSISLPTSSKEDQTEMKDEGVN
uniref:probable WRKY transcription factor 27 n=1 Tax=Erigeron canadensis TaxID=72917 RepID=UPI001CB8E10F|nr:probable WRKY transcription factor 27 [Erigeron canadensis]